MINKEDSIPLLTIAVPTYNGSKTIRYMLDILLPQVTPEVEVLISDNCSTDDTFQIIKEYKSKYPFIKIFCNDTNIGADGNFLQCMKHAEGKYIYLLSDDDVLIEGALPRILDFLSHSDDMGLVYLSTANFYIRYRSRNDCVFPVLTAPNDIVTTDKNLFMRYAYFYWGFLSSFIIQRKRFQEIQKPEEYFGTYWLQSYIHILCAKGPDTKLGIVGDFCVGAGVYLQQNNTDTALVDGVNYRKMLDFAIDAGFDRKQLDKWYIKRLCLLASHSLVKEKAAGNHIINKKLLYLCTRQYPQAWLQIYPVFFAPKFVCRMALGLRRKIKGAEFRATLNRIGDNATQRELDSSQ